MQLTFWRRWFAPTQPNFRADADLAVDAGSTPVIDADVVSVECVDDAPTPAVRSALPPLEFDSSLSLDDHVTMLAEALQDGITAVTTLKLSTVRNTYAELCALGFDRPLTRYPWNTVSQALSKRLGMSKRYRNLPDTDGIIRKTRVFLVPPGLVVDGDTPAGDPGSTPGRPPSTKVIPIRRAA